MGIEDKLRIFNASSDREYSIGSPLVQIACQDILKDANNTARYTLASEIESEIAMNAINAKTGSTLPVHHPAEVGIHHPKKDLPRSSWLKLPWSRPPRG